MHDTDVGALVGEDRHDLLSPHAPRRDREAEFADYMTWHYPRLLRTATLLCGDPHLAEDLTATAFAKLYLAWDQHDAARRDAYLRRILVNENNSWWRRAFHRREVVTGAPPDTSATDQATRDDALWSLVATLPRKQRAVIVLRFYEDRSEKETAEILGISVGTVKSQASRALATLRVGSTTLSHDVDEERS